MSTPSLDPNPLASVQDKAEPKTLAAEEKANFPSLEHDRHFLTWLQSSGHALFATSYKTNYLFSIGVTKLLKPEVREQVSFWMTPTARCMGMAADAENNLWVGNMSFLVKYCNQHITREDKGEQYERAPFDAVYVPRKLHVTSDIDVHDIVVPTQGEGAGVPHFVSAVYSCVCVPSETKGMKVFWKPDWLSKVAAEDRTHLNGLCCVDGVPRYVTACARSDVRGGWREKRTNGGVVWDIVNNALVCKGLSMPHSPRWHNGKLWVLNSGCGEFGYIDFDVEKVEDGEQYYAFVPCCFIPGYLRGLTFVGDRYAVVGSSDDRHDQVFSGLPLGQKLKEKQTTATCGLHVVDLTTFDVVHQMTFHKPITELYDVIAVPNIKRPVLEELSPMECSQYLSFE